MEEPQNWYVAQVKSRAEDSACGHLARRGIETFLPRLALPGWTGRPRMVVPMFPGYVFVRMALTQKFHAVAWSPGVRRLVGAGGQPAAVEERVVDFLRERAGADGIVSAHSDLTPGRHVRFDGGPFDGLSAIIERPPDAQGRVRVLMALLNGRVVRARVPVQQVNGGWTV
jgi:transcriptional antiterminator RfaH